MSKIKRVGGRPLIATVGVVAIGALLAACGSSGGGSTSTSGGESGGAETASNGTGSETTSCSPDTKIGMFLIAPVPLFNEMVAGFKQGYSAQTGVAEGEIQLDEQNAQGEPSNFPSMARQYANGSDEIIAAIGTPVIIALKQVTEKPIIGISMGEPTTAGVAKSNNEPGSNVTGSITNPSPGKFLSDVLAVDPGLKKIGTVFTTGNEYIPPFNKGLQEAGAEHGVEVVEVGITNTSELSSAARSLVGKVEAIVIGRDAEIAGALPSVASVASQAHVPVFLAYTGEGSLIPGVVGGFGSDETEAGRLAGEVAGKVCEGADPATTPFAVNQAFEWEYRRDELENYGLTIPADLKNRSKVVAGEKSK